MISSNVLRPSHGASAEIFIIGVRECSGTNVESALHGLLRVIGGRLVKVGF